MAYIAPLLKDAEPPRDDVEVLRPKVGRDRPQLQRIIDLHETGAIKAPNLHILPLEEAGAAHSLIDTHHVRGKIVLQVR